MASRHTGHPEHAPLAALELGVLLEGQGDPDGAAAAYRTAINPGHPEHAPFAELLMGEDCTGNDLQVRNEHRRRAADSGNPTVLPSIAELYLADGEVMTAMQLLHAAVQAGSTTAAGYVQLFTFTQDGTDAGADQALQYVLTSAEEGDTDSMNMLGLGAAARGDLDQARSWWTRSAASNDMIAPLLLSRHS